jgi:PPOX class probable F420-dependent enzyme
MEIDTSSEFGERVARRLEEEQVIWLTTVGPDETPQPSPVWFLWDGETVHVYSQPGTPKLRNIARNPRVSLNFNGTEYGGDIVVFTGDARIIDDGPPASAVPDYVAKYTGGIESIGMTPESFAQAYSTPIQITPTGLRGF